MKPIELKKNLSKDMKKLVKEYLEKGIKIFFAYRLDGYLCLYEMDETNYWKNGNFIKIYINIGD